MSGEVGIQVYDYPSQREDRDDQQQQIDEGALDSHGAQHVRDYG